MKRGVSSIAGAVLAFAAAGAAGAVDAAPDLQGAYAPRGDCAKEPRVVIGEAITVHAGGKATRFAPLDACYSCAGGASYSGIEVWVTYLGRNGDPMYPMFRVNADEKRGTLVVDKNDTQSAPAPVRAVAMASPLKKCRK